MRKVQKESILEIITTLEDAHKLIKQYLDTAELNVATGLLAECQNTAISLADIIEKSEGEECITIKVIEDYCNLLYSEAQKLVDNKEIDKTLNNKLFELIESIKKDIKVKVEVAFMPYKASMWDSLESIWVAANEDENCDAYVVPIPYYERNLDGSLGQFHYEGREFPKEIPIVDYKTYNLKNRRPDAIYVHNPYDEYNTVTSVEPSYYSSELKKYTNCLVYVPYYSTSGGMSEGQKYMPSYDNFDYIVVQAEKYKNLFAPHLTEKGKLLPFGSPKFDRVINMCKNPPSPPESWIKKMERKKVFFYNTSIGGMLANTATFLKKMQYVFETFANKKDICLIWRPHPLLENTIESMRPQYKSIYLALKEFFIRNELGIYDDTPDMTKTIALSDAYIGDDSTSVTSLFGMAGKPIFVLNNDINTLPEDNDWRKETLVNFNDEWLLTQENKLYHSPKKNYKFNYFCDLCEYSAGAYYFNMFNINKKLYITPINAQEILIVNEKGIEKRIKLKKYVGQFGTFALAIPYEKYIFLIPRNYPAIVRYNTENDEIKYFEDNLNVFISEKTGERLVGGATILNGFLFIASPVNNLVLALEIESGKMQALKTGAKSNCGCSGLFSDGNRLWFLPIWGNTVVSWEPFTGDTKEYSNWPNGFSSYHYINKCECNERPFFNVTFNDEYAYLSPCWGNMFVKLNKNTGEAVKWNIPINVSTDVKNGYYMYYARGYFYNHNSYDPKENKILYTYDMTFYNADFTNDTLEEIKIELDIDELNKHQSGFCIKSDWHQYCCQENAFNSLNDFVEGKIVGNQFSKDKQLASYHKIAANIDGTCGRKIHEFIYGKIK